MAAAATSTPAAAAAAPPLDPLVADFCTYLRRRDVSQGSYALAKKTVEIMREFIMQWRWNTAKDLIAMVQAATRHIESGRSCEFVVGNMARRVLRLIRESYAQCLNDNASLDENGSVFPTASLHELLTAPDRTCDYAMPFKSLRGHIMQAIQDLLEELEGSADNIAAQAIEHIHVKEIVMTLGHSSTVEAFLKAAAKKRSFHVIVAESAPSYKGQRMAMSLGQAGIETTLITDSAIFAVMSRVNKVLIGTSAIAADGGLMAVSGSHALAMAARQHSVPVIVCAATFKLCPKYLCTYDPDSFNRLACPTQIADYSEGDIAGDVHLAYPLFDFVPPDLVNLFISNIGGNAPSYVYRMLSEYYHEDDIDL